MKKSEKGLGKGLGSIFGEEAMDRGTGGFETVPISHVEPRKGQPRTVFDEEKIAELAASIEEHGLIQPLTVREIGDGFYQIIAGERRWRAARQAGLTEVPVRILDADDKTASELALVENLQREDLNPVEEAQGYQSLMSDYGLTQEEAAKIVGKSRPAVANAVRLLDLPETVLQKLEDGVLSAGAARAILSLPTEKLQKEAADKIIRDKLSVRQAEALVKQLISGKTQKTAKKNIYIEGIQRELGSGLSRKVKVTGDGKKGKIELSYYNEEDFEWLYNLLRGIKDKN